MTKTLLVLATASTLTLSHALAQSPSPPSPSTPPAQSSGTSGAASDKATNVQSTPGTSAAAPSAGAITAQTPDQWLATKFKGTQVIGADDAKIGSVDDILFDRTGSLKAVIVGVGGFLGIGSKQVAMPLPSFQVVAGKDGAADQLRLSMTKDQLASAPEFKPYEPPRPTASAPQRPATSGSNPMSPPPGRSSQ
jgi:hypothetical protein